MKKKTYICSVEQNPIPKFSLIVPVYNMAGTLDRCLTSICHQDYDNCETIIVDDGSTDNSKLVAESFIKSNPGYFKLVSQANGGLSAARNTGIQVARGNYITFVDADDELESGTLKLLSLELEERPGTDLLEYPFTKVYGERRERHSMPNKSFTDVDDYWLTGRAYAHSYACNKVFRRELFNDIRYPEKVVFEDIHTLPLLAKKANTISSTDKGGYIYHQNPGGITQQATARETSMLLDGNLKELNRMLSDNALKKKYSIELSRYYLHVLEIQLTLAKQGAITPQLPRFNPSFKAAENYKQMVKLILLKLLGIKKLCKIQRLVSR